MEQLSYLESHVFETKLKSGESVKVEFRVHMKMLSNLAGELGNSPTFFTTFPRVSSRKEDPNHKEKHKRKPNPYYHRKIDGKFGDDDGATWKPYTYEERVSYAEKVEAFKAADACSNMSQNPRRSVTAFVLSFHQ